MYIPRKGRQAGILNFKGIVFCAEGFINVPTTLGIDEIERAAYSDRGIKAGRITTMPVHVVVTGFDVTDRSGRDFGVRLQIFQEIEVVDRAGRNRNRDESELSSRASAESSAAGGGQVDAKDTVGLLETNA